MNLYLNGQDIHKLVIGEWEGELETINDTAPEHFLQHIVAFLNKKHVTLQEVQGWYVVIGPGSATALRTILAIVNTLRFALPEVQLFGIKKDPEKNDKLFIEDLKKEPLSSTNMLLPIYAHGPRITISKRDQLRRKK